MEESSLFCKQGGGDKPLYHCPKRSGGVSRKRGGSFQPRSQTNRPLATLKKEKENGGKSRAGPTPCILERRHHGGVSISEGHRRRN